MANKLTIVVLKQKCKEQENAFNVRIKTYAHDLDEKTAKEKDEEKGYTVHKVLPLTRPKDAVELEVE
eukprot:3468915-Amphidinium_carterae.2